MFAFLHQNFYLSELFGAKFTFKLGANAESYIEGEATGRSCGYPNDTVLNLLVFWIHINCNQILVDHFQFLQRMWKLRIHYRSNYIICLLLKVVSIALLAIWESLFYMEFGRFTCCYHWFDCLLGLGHFLLFNVI